MCRHRKRHPTGLGDVDTVRSRGCQNDSRMDHGENPCDPGDSRRDGRCVSAENAENLLPRTGGTDLRGFLLLHRLASTGRNRSATSPNPRIPPPMAPTSGSSGAAPARHHRVLAGADHPAGSVCTRSTSPGRSSCESQFDRPRGPAAALRLSVGRCGGGRPYNARRSGASRETQAVESIGRGFGCGGRLASSDAAPWDGRCAREAIGRAALHRGQC